MQVILGANGAIGVELAKNLPQYTDRIRLVSRNPKKVNPTDEVVSADLTNAEQTLKAVGGSEIAYLTAGLKYDISVWRSQWPVIMKNVIEACKRHNTKLVFFDNVYMYGKVDGWMTEETPARPTSKKGEIRASIAEMLMNEVKKGNLQALVARSADFYGHNTNTSVVGMLVFDNLMKGKKAQWLVTDQAKHSQTYIPDAGKATALLGNSPDAFNRIWHLPTDKNVLNGKEFIEKVAKEFGVEPRYSILSKWMLQMAGLFNVTIRESIEMLYQSASDYLFDSSRFEKAFSFKATTYEEGIRETVRHLQQSSAKK
ncbi:MAG: NAD-dependent epimerase/dehydratase [Bacteroidetes bacterium]|nr:NAD-dependent epimerase/dehydratase [Bacteroidota bacterium]